jgi:hypothetical protein
MAGLVPAIHVFLAFRQQDVDARTTSDKRIIQIVPFGIRRVDKADLPGAGPVFDCRLALNCGPNIIEVFHVNQSLQSVVFRKSINKALPVFVRSPRQITCDADVQDAVAPIGHEINPAARHFQIKARRGWPEQVRP